jgi:hypothetical protein
MQKEMTTLKNVLLLGDSIRMSYMPLVRERLADRAVVNGPDENCRFAAYTLWHVSNWRQAWGKPDIVHWNNGIWDVYRHNDEMGIFTDLDVYLNNLQRILRELRRAEARILWATTTPVLEPHPRLRNSDIDLYNAEASSIMTAEGIEINDLNAIIRKDPAGLLAEDHLHLSEAGKVACADRIAAVIGKYLSAP